MFKKIFFALFIMILFIGFVSAGDLNNATFDDLSNDINDTAEHNTLYLKKDYQSTNMSKQIIIDKSITIDGKMHTINAPNVDRVFLVKADNVVIKNINFVNANYSSLAGGVISWLGDNGSLINCNFSNNSAKSGGGAVVWLGDNALLENCNFTNNSVYYGPAVSLTSHETFDSSKIHIQIVEAHGGALYFNGDKLQINNCNFLNNYAHLSGGAISTSWGTNIKINNSRFKNNNDSYSGAIDLNSNNVTLSNSVFSNNSPVDLFNNCKNTVILNTTFTNSSSVISWYDYQNIDYFNELIKLINDTPEGGLLTLDKDYQYLNGSNKGILISKSITIDGKGHSLNGCKLSRIFNVTSDNVMLKNINFINGKAYGKYFSNDAGGGAIYWNGADGVVENCNFTNNSGSGIEDDPFDKEETSVGEDGTVIHTIRMRPMGAKINEGGAIVWNGTNGIVSNCIFINNTVGYPNTGGAICWRGDNGKILNSEFYKNSAWCGSAIAWMGSNGTILYSKVANNGFFDGGIYWFGENGTVKYSILLPSQYRSVLRPIEGRVNADYNFWGDTIDNPNQTIKINGVQNWFVLNATYDGEFLIKDSNVIIDYNINSLFDNGKIIYYLSPIDYSGQINYNVSKTGFLNVSIIDGEITVKIDSKDHVTSKDLKTYYTKVTVFTVNVYDVLGKVVNGSVKFKVNKKVYNINTDKEGVANLKVKLNPGKYNVYTYYGDVKVKNSITVKNTLITKNLSKKFHKSAKFKIKVLNSKGKSFKKQSVKIRFKNKNYKLKTNHKGIAYFKLPKSLKIGKYKIKIKYKGLTKVNKIKVKK